VLVGLHKIDGTLILANMMKEQARALQRLHFPSAVVKAVSLTVSFKATWKHIPIALAVRSVGRKSGKIPWSELAYALEAVRAGYGIDADISPDALRREHERFTKSKAGKAFESSGLPEMLLGLQTPS
jgi:hypothetical protein